MLEVVVIGAAMKKQLVNDEGKLTIILIIDIFSFFKQEMPNFFWFQLFKCKTLLLFCHT